jgi:hypothetical protein
MLRTLRTNRPEPSPTLRIDMPTFPRMGPPSQLPEFDLLQAAEPAARARGGRWARFLPWIRPASTGR